MQLDLFEDLELEGNRQNINEEDCLIVKLDSYKTPLKLIARRGRESTDEGCPIKASLNVKYVLNASCNPLYTRELYIAPDVVGLHDDLLQTLGDLGIYANAYIDETTDYVVISDASLALLKQGVIDDEVRYVEQNILSRTNDYRCIMLCESELMSWLQAVSR